VYKKLAHVRRVAFVRRFGELPTIDRMLAARGARSLSVLRPELRDLDRLGQCSDVELEQPPATPVYPPRQQ